MLKRLTAAAALSVSLWPVAASAGTGIQIVLTSLSAKSGLDDVDLLPPGQYPGCDVDIQYVNDTENHLDEITGYFGDLEYNFEIKDLVAHGTTGLSFTAAHSCRYVLWQFQQLAAHARSLALNRCAMEGEREGDCISMVTLGIDPSVAPQSAAAADSATRAALQKYQKCYNSVQWGDRDAGDIANDYIKQCFGGQQ